MHKPLNKPCTSNVSPRQVHVYPCLLGMTSHRYVSGTNLGGEGAGRKAPSLRANGGRFNLHLLTRLPNSCSSFPPAHPSSRWTQSQPLSPQPSRAPCGFSTHSSSVWVMHTGEHWGSPDPGRKVNPPSSPKEHQLIGKNPRRGSPGKQPLLSCVL